MFHVEHFRGDYSQCSVDQAHEDLSRSPLKLAGAGEPRLSAYPVPIRLLTRLREPRDLTTRIEVSERLL